MIYRAKTKHPVTGRRIHLRARSERELEAYKHRVESLASELRLGLTSAEDVSRALRRLEHGVVTLERAANAYAERSDLAANTRGRVRALLTTQIAPLAALELVQLDSSVLKPWLDQLRARGLEVTTIATTWRTLRSVIRYAAERGWIGALPWGAWRPTLWGGKSSRAPREACRSIAELARLIAAGAAVDEADDDLALEPKIAAAGLLGLRQGELAGLRWPDLTRGPERLDDDGRASRPLMVSIERQWQGAPLKNRGRRRKLETIEELATILERHRLRLVEKGLYLPAGPVFPSPAHSRRGVPKPYPSGRVISSIHLRQAVALAGLPNVQCWSAHSLRDTFVTLENQAMGGDLARLATRSGHSSIASLARYFRSADRQPSGPGIKALPTLPGSEVPPLLVGHLETTK